MPPAQRPDMHGWLHPPQFLGSFEVSVHTPPQYVPVGHGSMHEPFTHSAPFAQRCPHPPQFAGSKRQSTQTPEQ
jgi:hypothetical protein